jgi:hypothetical protein
MVLIWNGGLATTASTIAENRKSAARAERTTRRIAGPS